MKKMNLIIAAAIVMTGFTACNSSTANEAKQDAEDLNVYVDSVETVATGNTVSNWSAIDKGYQEKAVKAETNSGSLTPAEKAKMEESKTKYADLKTTNESKLKAQQVALTPDYRMTLRNQLFGEGKIGTDMKFEYVTAENILSVYRNFVNVVDDNKNAYSREDWDEIKVLYEALDTRKNTVEKDLSGKDNMAIAGLKIKFASIKAAHRGGTKGEENREAKNQ